MLTMKLAGLALVATTTLLLTDGCGTSGISGGIPSDTSNHSYFVVTKESRLELDIIDNQRESLQGSFPISKAYREAGNTVAPKSITMRGANEEIWVVIGTVNDPSQNKVYQYDGKTGKLSLKTTIPSISNWTVAGNQVWTIRRENNTTYMEAYEPKENWKRTNQIKLDTYPTDVAYDSSTGIFYTLATNAMGNAYSVEEWSTSGQKLHQITLPGRWAYGGLAVWNGAVWVSQTTLHPDAKDTSATSGNHVLRLSASLHLLQSWPVIEAPGQLFAEGADLYVLSATQTESKVGIYSWTNGQLALSRTCPFSGGLYHLGLLQRDPRQLYALGDGQLAVFSQTGSTSIKIGGSSDNTWLP